MNLHAKMVPNARCYCMVISNARAHLDSLDHDVNVSIVQRTCQVPGESKKFYAFSGMWDKKYEADI